MEESKSFLMYMQEPYIEGESKMAVDLNYSHQIIKADSSKCRALIYGHRDLSLWKLDEFCSPDVAACVLNHSKNGYAAKQCKKMLCLSVYWDILFAELPPPRLIEL
jgi:hypothetical protein